MDASIFSYAPFTKSYPIADPHSPSLQFADGGSYSQAKLSEAILETEKTRKAFDAKTQAEAEERAAKESSLKQEDVDALVSTRLELWTVSSGLSSSRHRLRADRSRNSR